MPSQKLSFVVVPFPHAIDAPMSVEEANDRTSWMSEMVDEGAMTFVAFAEGERLCSNGETEEVMFFLMYDRGSKTYAVYENWNDEWEEAVLIDGGAQNEDRPLPPEQALARWIAGFMVMNEAAPGSHRLRYRR